MLGVVLAMQQEELTGAYMYRYWDRASLVFKKV